MRASFDVGLENGISQLDNTNSSDDLWTLFVLLAYGCEHS